jgi:hypothetical protein
MTWSPVAGVDLLTAQEMQALYLAEKNELVAIKAALQDATPAAVVGLSAVVPQLPSPYQRPADTNNYAAGDLIANSATAGSVVPMNFEVARVEGGTGSIRRARIFSSALTDINAAVRLHLFRNSPVVANGDSGAFSVNGLTALYMGALEGTLDSLFSDGVGGIAVPRLGGEINFHTLSATTNPVVAGSKLIYGLLEARSAITVTSGATYSVRLEVFRD